ACRDGKRRLAASIRCEGEDARSPRETCRECRMTNFECREGTIHKRDEALLILELRRLKTGFPEFQFMAPLLPASRLSPIATDTPRSSSRAGNSRAIRCGPL